MFPEPARVVRIVAVVAMVAALGRAAAAPCSLAGSVGIVAGVLACGGYLLHSYSANLFRRVLAGTALIAVCVFCAELVGDVRGSSRRWSFVEDTSLASLNLHASHERSGAWAIEDHDTATGARALVNREGNGGPPAVLVARSIRTRDVAATTRCKSSAQCGLVFRYRNDDNYEVARFDAATEEVVLALVSGGRESTLASASATATATEAWQDLRVEAAAGVIRVRWNGRLLIESAEGASASSGYVGLWVPAEASAYFDELSIEALPDAPRTLELLPLLGPSSG